MVIKQTSSGKVSGEDFKDLALEGPYQLYCFIETTVQ